MNNADNELQLMRKVRCRIVPLVALAMLCCYLDKVNVGFAALQMNRELGLSNTAFGAAAGFFAIGYTLAGIPSTLLLHRVGARRWISLIMMAWGLCSAATALVTNAGQLMVVRLLLGMAEAGFAPGVIVYFSSWFPDRYRGRVLGYFFAIGPIGLLIGGPLSSALLAFEGTAGVSGWQWLFIIEAVPTLILAAVIFSFLRDKPDDAPWLSADEKRALAKVLADGRPPPDASRSGGQPIARTLADPRVWTLALVYLCIGTSGIGATFFMPLVIQSMGFSIWNAGLLTAVPAAAAALALPLWGIWTDRVHSREIVVATACCMIAAGLLGAAALLPSPWALAPIALAMVGFYGSVPAFWTLPGAFLAGAGAAAGIAFINLTGNLGNFTGPTLLGWMSDLTRSYDAGMAVLAGIAAAAAALMTAHVLVRRNGRERRQMVTEP